jgi:hypothetical protein
VHELDVSPGFPLGREKQYPGAAVREGEEDARPGFRVRDAMRTRAHADPRVRKTRLADRISGGRRETARIPR